MTIAINTLCYQCHLNKRLEQARQLGTEEQAMAFSRELMVNLAALPEGTDSTDMGAMIEQLLQKHYALDPDRLRPEREASNRFVLDRLESIYSRVEAAKDPVFAALQFAVLGNYLDFSALQGEVSFDALDTMLEQALDMELDMDSYRHLCQDLENGKKLLYITDNAGEIVFDRVLAEKLQQKYPHLEITFCVRGKPVTNDAIREDAETAGVQFPIIDNGTDIGGTVLHRIGEEMKKALEEADVIIAKGMGNTESMYGCGYNVYYAFLVKCIRFIQFFNKPKMTPMLVREKDKK